MKKEMKKETSNKKTTSADSRIKFTIRPVHNGRDMKAADVSYGIFRASDNKPLTQALLAANAENCQFDNRRGFTAYRASLLASQLPNARLTAFAISALNDSESAAAAAEYDEAKAAADVANAQKRVALKRSENKLRVFLANVNSLDEVFDISAVVREINESAAAAVGEAHASPTLERVMAAAQLANCESDVKASLDAVSDAIAEYSACCGEAAKASKHAAAKRKAEIDASAAFTRKTDWAMNNGII